MLTIVMVGSTEVDDLKIYKTGLSNFSNTIKAFAEIVNISEK